MSQAREIAVRLLNRVRTETATLDQLMEAAEAEIRRLNRPDRALVHALVYGVLRWQGRLDWFIDHLATKSPKKIDPLVRIIMRIGVYQILYMDRIPPSAAVNTSVELTKTFKKKWAGGFTNALLRGMIRRGHEVVFPDRAQSPEAHLAATHAFPRWLVAKWIRHRGLDETEALCQSTNAIPPVTLRTNTLKSTRAKLMAQLDTETQRMQTTDRSPEGIHLWSLKRPLTDWPAYGQGLFQVQSEAAQLIGHLVAPRPGERIWDACAGLGTKTAHLAQLMENKGHILASDVQQHKLDRLREDMQRLGIDIVETCRVDLNPASPDFAPPKFDRILVDAPCSGLGVLQRNPDGKWHTSPADIHANRKKQQRLLSAVAAHLKPDGVLVYAVCSMEPEENETVAEHFLQMHPEFGIYRPEQASLKNIHMLQTPEGYLKTSPHAHGLDGFFAAVFKRKQSGIDSIGV